MNNLFPSPLFLSPHLHHSGRVFGILLALSLPLAAGQLPNPAVTASARPFNASFTAANLFDTADAEYASLGQGAVSTPFTINTLDGTWVEMDFGSTVEFDRFVLRTRNNAVDVIGRSRLIVSVDPTFDATDRIFTFEPTGSSGSGPVRNLNEVVSGRYVRWEVITRTGSGLNLGGNQMWFLRTAPGHSLLPPPTVINSSPQFSAGFPPAAAVNGDYGIEYASLGAQGNMFIDFDFGAGERYPRVSPAALADPDAPLDPGPGRSLGLNAGFSLQPRNEFHMSLDYTKSRLRRNDTGLLAFDENIFSLRSTYQFTRFVFVRARADYDTLDSSIRGQLLFGYTPNPGTAFYVGYNDDISRNGFNPFTGQLEPGFRRNGRTFFVKVSYLIRKSFGG